MTAKIGAADSAMDAEFLKRTVGEPLSDALTALVVAQPADPIEFIGEALLDFIKRREAEAKRIKHAEDVARLLEMAREQEEIARAESAAREAAVQAKSDVERQAEEAIVQTSTHPELYAKALGLVKERLGASGVQLGRKVVVEGQEIVEFIAASEGREYMVGKEIKGLKEGEDPEDGEAKEEGVTFGLWKKTEQPPPAEAVYDEEGEIVPDENEPELIPPEHVLIENVVRDPRVKFFGIPKLGAYLALPITYGSWLHPGGISDAPPSSEDEEAPDEGEGGSNEAGADAAAEEEGRCFNWSDILWAKSWAAKMKANVEALECRMFEDEAALIPSLRGSEVTDLVAKVTEGEETAVAEALALLEPGTPEDEKDRVTKNIQYRIKTKAVEAVGDLVSLMGKLNLAPPVAVLDVLERALLLVGKGRADLCDSRCARSLLSENSLRLVERAPPTYLQYK
ncbi:conserved unknown protein [Ectocarpus siliculosus]|uniref:Uncharacterized protein n=1 Tax=Ectocarpus siliculosus TaxID=2880 RepID=D8LRV6_ECTSI|nr:conserved unknown protein [Ectocarpus siliculosus]|eukprot:CBN73873.1 conserved unknown protein [Ectocarpus siliculosus]